MKSGFFGDDSTKTIGNEPMTGDPSSQFCGSRLCSITRNPSSSWVSIHPVYVRGEPYINHGFPHKECSLSQEKKRRDVHRFKFQQIWIITMHEELLEKKQIPLH